MKKRLASIALAIALLAGSVFTGAEMVSAAEVANAAVTYLESAAEYDAKAVLSHETVFTVADGASTENWKETVKIDIPKDSVVCLEVQSSETASTYFSGSVVIHSDEALKNSVGEKISYNYSNPNAINYYVLKKGAYYAQVSGEEGYQTAKATEAHVKLFVTAFAVSDVVTVQPVSKKNDSYQITLSDKLGDIVKNKYYIAGAFTPGETKDLKEITKDASVVKLTKPGKYTVVYSVKDTQYSWQLKDTDIVKVTVNVKDITKPTVSGVKNGKTYTKAVTVKFSDKGSGIKSAKLNGKSIKSGAKVSKKGAYTLVVTDKAGNKNTVKFKMK